MNRTIKILAILISLLLAAPNLYAKDRKSKIGYVDLYKIFGEYSKTKESETALEKKAKEKNAEKEKLVKKIKTLQEEAELLNKKEKEKKEAELEDELKKLRDFDLAVRDELNRERDSQGRDILLEIGKAIAKYGEKNNFDMLFDSRTLFYGSDAVDITDEIVKEMNKKE